MQWQEQNQDFEPADAPIANKPSAPRGSGWLDRRGLLRRLLEPAPQPTPAIPPRPKPNGAGKASR